MASLKTTKQININTPSINTLTNNHNHPFRNIFKDHSSSSKLIIYQQNIQGISKKTDELLISLYHNKPQIICLTEHHLKAEEINHINLVLRCDIPVVYCSQCTVGESGFRREHNRL
jgi:predicted nucleotide-binding protein (sugar kinase/HSP70/actin superfamily)